MIDMDTTSARVRGRPRCTRRAAPSRWSTRCSARRGAGVGASLHRPPGHHATAGRAMGFCLLNNVAIAAQHALDAGGAERVLVVDWDVHHGNGTNDIFYARDDVLFCSIHQWPLYPGTGRDADTGEGPGEGYTVNLPVPGGSGDARRSCSLVEHVVRPLARAYAPDLVLVSAGYDAHADDPLGGLPRDRRGLRGDVRVRPRDGGRARRAARDRARGRLRPRRAGARRRRHARDGRRVGGASPCRSSSCIRSPRGRESASRPGAGRRSPEARPSGLAEVAGRRALGRRGRLRRSSRRCAGRAAVVARRRVSCVDVVGGGRRRRRSCRGRGRRASVAVVGVVVRGGRRRRVVVGIVGVVVGVVGTTGGRDRRGGTVAGAVAAAVGVVRGRGAVVVGELDEREREHRAGDEDDRADRDGRQLPVRRLGEARAGGRAALQAPVLIGADGRRAARAAQRAGRGQRRLAGRRRRLDAHGSRRRSPARRSRRVARAESRSAAPAASAGTTRRRGRRISVCWLRPGRRPRGRARRRPRRRRRPSARARPGGRARRRGPGAARAPACAAGIRRAPATAACSSPEPRGTSVAAVGCCDRRGRRLRRGGDRAADLAHRLRAAELQAAARAEVVLAGVQRPAALARRQPRLAQLVDRAAVVEHALERAQLAVDRAERGELRLDEVGAVAVEAAHVEDEPADVAERELARAAQEAQPPAQPAAVAEARRAGRDVDDLGGLDGGRRRVGRRPARAAGVRGRRAPRAAAARGRLPQGSARARRVGRRRDTPAFRRGAKPAALRRGEPGARRRKMRCFSPVMTKGRRATARSVPRRGSIEAAPGRPTPASATRSRRARRARRPSSAARGRVRRPADRRPRGAARAPRATSRGPIRRTACRRSRAARRRARRSGGRARARRTRAPRCRPGRTSPSRRGR